MQDLMIDNTAKLILNRECKLTNCHFIGKSELNIGNGRSDAKYACEINGFLLISKTNWMAKLVMWIDNNVLYNIRKNRI